MILDTPVIRLQALAKQVYLLLYATPLQFNREEPDPEWIVGNFELEDTRCHIRDNVNVAARRADIMF